MKSLSTITPHEICGLPPGEQLDRLVAEALGLPTPRINNPDMYSYMPSHLGPLMSWLREQNYRVSIMPVDESPLDDCDMRGEAKHRADRECVLETGVCEQEEHAAAMLVALAGKRRLDAELAAGLPVGFVDEDPDGDHASEDLKRMKNVECKIKNESRAAAS